MMGVRYMNNIVEGNAARRKMAGKLILIFLLVMLVLTFFSNTILNFSLPRVKTEQPSSGAIVREISSEGIVEAKELIYVYAGAGRMVKDISLKAGDMVEKDQVIAILDKEELERDLDEENIRYEKLKLEMEKLTGDGIAGSLKNLERNVEQAKKKLKEAGEHLKLVITLYEAGAESRDSLKQAEKDLESTKADYEASMENYSLEKASNEIDIKNLQYDIELQANKLEEIQMELKEGTEIKAPCSGVVKDIGFRKGTYTVSDMPLCTIADTGKGFQFRAGINKEKSKYLSQGDEVEINIKSMGGKRISGKIREITQNMQNNYDMADLLIDIPQEELSGGEPGDISISKKTRFYNILVPNSALNEEDMGKFIYLLKEVKGPLGNEYYVQKTGVVVGDSDSFRTAITSGIGRDDRIIVKSDKFISDGSRVMPTR
jgi:RND family efflux transporter MFP subunit